MLSTFSTVKFKLKIPVSTAFCARQPVLQPFDMISIIQRFVRHAFVFRQGFLKRKLTIGKKVGQQQQQKIVRANRNNNNNSVNAVALTKQNPHGDYFQAFLNSVAGTVREVFITNALKRNSNLVRLFQNRFAHGGRPALGLVGFGLVSGGQILREKHEFEEICAEIRNTLRPAKENFAVEEVELEELEAEPALGPLRYIGKGQCGAIYESTLNGEDVAVKVMFNFSHQSNSATILRGMMRELVPAKQRIKGLDLGDLRKCTPHPNIVDIKCVLTSRNKPLPGALEHWPDALPQSLSGYGRNMTMYVVMAKYDENLESYLQNTELNLRQRVLILAQMLEGVSHLRRQGIAHRDLKADNFLVKQVSYPHIVITDFGLCLASKDAPLQLRYESYDVEIGGNVALLAPELLAATPGPYKWLSYEHSDTWAVGAIAYQVFGLENPFYNQLSSKDYSEEDLPDVTEVPSLFQRLVKGLLRKNPQERLKSELAATVCYIFLWGPRNWLQKGREAVNDFDTMQWLMLLTTKAVTSNAEGTEMNVINTFLQRVTYRDVYRAVGFCQEE